MVEEYEGIPYAEVPDRILSRVREIERSLDRIHGQLDKKLYDIQESIAATGYRLDSIARAVWILVWIGIGGILIALLNLKI